MDVTPGLKIRLTKTKSTERVLAPIASQITLLMILNDVGVQDEDSVDSSAFSISTCVDRLAHALEGFISVGQGQIQSSQDPIFLSQMSAACENLEVAKTQLYVAGQVVSSASNNTTAHLGLGKAARDVMQAVLRILVIADDVEVRKCSAAIIAVQEKLKNVGSLKDPHGSTPAFKALSEAMLYLSVVLNQRHKDLVSGIQQEQLVAGLNLLHKGVSSLHMAVQTYLKYPRNSQALVGKQQVLDQVLATLSDLHTVIESDPTDLDPEQSGYFVNNVDKVVEGLAENHRFELSPDFECWVATIVRHAMGVARLCQSTYKHLITNICQRILQSKFRLFELRTTLTYSCTLADTESDYASICEVLLDEFCDVEKQVNMALLNLIVDSCCFAFEPLQNLAHAAIHYQEGMVESLGQSVLAQEFRQHMVRMCQVASMATASAMDSKKVSAVRFSVHRLEQLDPVVLPAVLSAARRPVNVQAVRQLKLLVQEWTKEMDALIQALDSMTDPGIFLYISEQRIQQCANVLRTKIEERDKMGVKNVVKKLLSHSHRMVQVSRRVVDNSCDAVFRNGLLVFVHGMISAGNNLKDATWAVLENTYHVRLVDTLHRRLDLLLQATRDLVQGVKGNNHVDILSSARHNVRHHMEAFTAFTAHYDDGASSNLGTSRKKSNGFTTQKHKTNEHKTDTSMVEVGTVTESPVDITINTCIPDSRSVTTPCNKSCLQKENILQKEHHCRQPGKLTSLLQACGDGLFAVAAARDRMGLSEWSGDILSWTSHLCEAAFCLINHCHQIVRHSEMKELTVAVDKLAAQVIEAARYVAAGDDGHVSTLRQQSEEWIAKCDKMRILVDVAVADWLLLIEQVETVATGQDTEKLKSLLALVERNQREVKRLLGRTRELKHQHIPQGTQVLQFLCEGMSHLEHLTANFKTAAECQATPQSSEDVRNIRSTQFMQQGREWCVLMTCLISELDFISDSLAIAGKSTLGIPFNTASVPTTGIHHSHSSNKMVATSGTHHPHRSKKVVAFLQSETIHLKEILTCLSAGETDMKAQCKELSQALVETLKEVNEIADTPVDDISFPQAQLFARLDAELALSCWMDKALEVDELAKHNCLKYSLFIDNLFPEATGTSPSGIYTGHGRAWSTTVQTALPVLSDKVKVFTQRTLQAIQLSANLQHRATVRRCLDDLNNLVPTITQSAYGCALGSSDSEQKTSELELKKMSVYWGAKVFCLISTLRMMDDIKPSLTDELDRLLRAEWQTWRDSQSLTFHPFTSTHAKDTSLTHERKNTVTESSSTKMDTDSSTQGDSTPLSSSSMKTSSYQRSALYNSWLASANYLAGEVECWEDESNNFVQLVRDMAKQCQQMADFARGGQSLKNSKEMASTAVALAGRGRELEKFACSLQAMCSKGRNMEDLRLAGEKIAMYTCQLRIVANMVQNAPSSPECDSILARNASNLVQAVREMFATAESVSIASQLNPREGSDLDHQVVDLLTRWQQKLASYRLQQANTSNTDALGLRRMERHNPPSLTNLLEN